MALAAVRAILQVILVTVVQLRLPQVGESYRKIEQTLLRAVNFGAPLNFGDADRAATSSHHLEQRKVAAMGKSMLHGFAITIVVPIGTFEPMFACRLVGRAVIPSSRLPKGWKFQHHHVLEIRALSDFLVSVRDAERDRMTREGGGSHLLVKIELSLVVRPLFYEDHIGYHGVLLFSSDCLNL
jgi:hypothetical protein